MKKGWLLVILFQLSLVMFVIFLIKNGTTNVVPLRIVAAENFWGSIASQIGGNRVLVDSIVSDPNADPHEYESSAKDARDFANSKLVIINGLGYDSWANKLIDANPIKNRDVLNVGEYLNLKIGDNPHVWYNISYTKLISKQIYNELSKLDPENSSYYLNNYTKLNNSLNSIISKENSIAAKYKNTSVASTESIFYYMAKEMNLKLISPYDFMQSISEGNDPPAISVATFINQLNLRQPAILIYNQQTESPITESMKNLAKNNNIQVIGVTETMPIKLTYQEWMNNQINQIDRALSNAR